MSTTFIRNLFLTVTSTVGTVILLSTTKAAAETMGLCNFDVRNDTAFTANDFEVCMTGVSPSQVLSLYKGCYTNTIISGDSNQTCVHWAGCETASGETSHFGISLPSGVIPSEVTFTWTLDFTPIRVIPGQWQSWKFINNKPVLRDTIPTNNFGTNRLIQRRINYITNTIRLDELMVTNDIWLNATLVDASPIRMTNGQIPFTYDFALSSSNQSYVMMYSIYEDDANGQASSEPLITFLNAYTGFDFTTPVITNILVSSSKAIIGGTNGPQNFPFYVQTGTNVASGLSVWKTLSTNAFDSNGNFIVTNKATNQAQFFILKY